MSEKDVERDQLAELREMEKQGEQLNETIEDARNAVQAAHDANTMGSPGVGENTPGVGDDEIESSGQAENDEKDENEKER